MGATFGIFGPGGHRQPTPEEVAAFHRQLAQPVIDVLGEPPAGMDLALLQRPLGLLFDHPPTINDPAQKAYYDSAQAWWKARDLTEKQARKMAAVAQVAKWRKKRSRKPLVLEGKAKLYDATWDGDWDITFPRDDKKVLQTILADIAGELELGEVEGLPLGRVRVTIEVLP